MRIALIGPFALEPKGTTSGRALPLAAALARRGHDVRLVVPPWDNPQYSGRRISLQGMEIWHTPLPPRFPPLWYPLLTWRTVRLALKHRPQAIHAFKPKAFSGLAAMSCWLLQRANLTRARLVVDTDDWEGQGGWNELGPYGPLQRKVFAFQEPWGLRHADAVTVASRALASMVSDVGVPDERIFYLPNGTAGGSDDAAVPVWIPASAGMTGVPNGTAGGSDDAAAPVWIPASAGMTGVPNGTAGASAGTTGVPNGTAGWGGATLRPADGDAQRLTLLLYTRFFEFKARRLVSIFQEVLRQAPQATLLVLGQGLQGEEREVSRLVQESGIGDRVEMAGWVRREELPGYFARAHVALYPLDDTLLNRAKCPLKLVELMEAGLPVIADCVGQAAEYIVDGESGLLAPPGDVPAFAGLVARLLQDADLRRRIGENARTRVLTEFNWDRLAKVAEEAYGL